MLFTSCTVGDGGSGHRLDVDTSAIKPRRELTAKVMSTGAIVTIDNYKGIKIIPGDSVLIAYQHKDLTWIILPNGDMEDYDDLPNRVKWRKARILAR